MSRWKRWLGVVCMLALMLCSTLAVTGPAAWASDATDAVATQDATQPILTDQAAGEQAAQDQQATSEAAAATEGQAADEQSTSAQANGAADAEQAAAAASTDGKTADATKNQQAAPAADDQKAASTADENDQKAVQFDRVSLEIGATEAQRNFNWQATSNEAGKVQVAVKPSGWKQGDAFPTKDAQTVDAADPVTNTANDQREGWYTYRATVKGLKAQTAYVYRVSAGDAWSDAYTFTTGKMGAGESFSFMFAGDPQIGASGNNESDTKGWTNTLDTMEAAFPGTDFLISAGDQINASAANTVESEYEGYFAPQALHSTTLATNVGNHETYAGNQHYSYNFNMPNRTQNGAVDSTGEQSGDYWYTYNGVLFMSLNSNDMNTADHKAFMQDAIAQNPDANWKIVTFHHSVYSVASHTQDTDILQRRSELPQVFSDLDIDAVLMGHDHVYTRTYMMEGGTPVIPADGKVPTEVTDPADGQVLYITANSASGSKYYAIKNGVQNAWAAVQDQSQRENMTRVEVSKDALTFTTYFTDDGQVTDADVLDTFTIKRTPEQKAPKIDRVSLEIGATEAQRNFNWQATSDAAEQVQIVAEPSGWKQGDAFPTKGAQTVDAAKPVTNAANDQREGWYTFRATVKGLKPQTTYLYRVGDGTTWSDTYAFTTGKMGKDESFSFMFAGDPQIGASGNAASDTKGWEHTLDLMNAAFPGTDFLISAGDQINASDPSVLENEYEGYFAPDALHGMTLATNVGNHETGANNQHYSYNFNMPNESSLGVVDSTGKQSGDYWFTYNNVLFMSLNSNNMSTSEHKAFMEDAIAKNPDANWKIVTFHHSVYSVANHTQDTDILQRRSDLPPVFSKLGIDAVLMGHDHVYTRTYLMDGTTPQIPADGTVPSTLTDPKSGEVLYITANSASGSKYYEIQNLPQNTWAAVTDQSHRQNMTRVEVSDDELVFTTYYTDGSKPEVLDQVSIKRTKKQDEQGGQSGQGGQQGGQQPGGQGTQGGSGNNGSGNTGTQTGSGNTGTQTGANTSTGTDSSATNGQNTTAATKPQSGMPQTGDTFNPALVAGIAVAGVAALAGGSALYLKRKHS